MISRVVKVLEFPKRRAESIATVHVRPKSLSATIPGGEANLRTAMDGTPWSRTTIAKVYHSAMAYL